MLCMGIFMKTEGYERGLAYVWVNVLIQIPPPPLFFSMICLCDFTNVRDRLCRLFSMSIPVGLIY